MVERNVTIVNKLGMHARASAQFVSFVYRFKCDITLIRDTKKANAKSILNLLMMSLNCGSEITVRVEGENEEDVLDSIVNYIENMKD
ncbi:MAG: HPr family phosphocarrier protein [Lachnospiraceae bacterium]|nr:HPr family phosphocarrier protein [Lachnospiraceae bacterium]